MSVAQPKIFWTKVPTLQFNTNLLNESFIKGRRITIAASSGSSQDIYTIDFDATLIKLGVHMSAYTDVDWWNLSGSNWTLCETIYTKTVPESFVLETGKGLSSGSDVIFDFYNSSATGKIVWVDYYFIR